MSFISVSSVITGWTLPAWQAERSTVNRSRRNKSIYKCCFIIIFLSSTVSIKFDFDCVKFRLTQITHTDSVKRKMTGLCTIRPIKAMDTKICIISDFIIFPMMRCTENMHYFVHKCISNICIIRFRSKILRKHRASSIRIAYQACYPQETGFPVNRPIDIAWSVSCKKYV